MKIIYAVTSGEYSDYGINAMFDSREKAEAFIAYESAHGHSHYGDFGIEEWELNQYYDPIKRGLVCYMVSFENITQGDATVEPHSACDEVEGSHHNYRTQVRDYTTYVWAKGEGGALKIANERRVQYLLRLEQEESK